jgi:hypothetical protein
MTDDDYDKIMEDAYRMSREWNRSVAGRACGQVDHPKNHFEYWVAKAAFEYGIDEHQFMRNRYHHYVTGKLYELKGLTEPISWDEFVAESSPIRN